MFDPPRDGSAPSVPQRPARRWSVLAAALITVTALVAGVVLAAVLQRRAEGSGAAVGDGGRPSAGDAVTADAARCNGETDTRLRYSDSIDGPDGPIPFSVSLPADYRTACNAYPVLFALHGKGDTHETFLPEAEAIRAAVDDGVLDDVVIVTPDSALDQRWEGRYETDFIDRLIPYIEDTLRVRPGPTYRLLTGFSMGGHGAFRLALKYPERFAAVWAVDGAVTYDPADYLQYLDTVRADRPDVVSIGGTLNGARVKTVIDAFKSEGVDLPASYAPLEHDYSVFVDADRAAGWPTARWLDARLGAL